ncbi:MAG: NYN domain-containing protein [Coriobacteriales bacterium]|jgi:predicted RNA-binding protein with PIN domain|nr:NYN domain-containing protein [Coriobacteriales bacterium]
MARQKHNKVRTPSTSDSARKVLLVDGYNVIRSGFLYQHLASDSPDHSQDAFNAAREALLGDVAGFAGREMRATVVFDGAGNPGSGGERQSFGPVAYLFSPFGVSADTIIEQRAKAAAKEGLEVLVVTSDATLQWTVFGARVTRMSADGFCEEVLALRQSLEELSAPGANTPTIKNTLAERIDPEISARLERFARGKD